MGLLVKMTDQESFHGAAAIQGFIAERKKMGSPFTEINGPTSVQNLKQSLSFKMGDEVNIIFEVDTLDPRKVDDKVIRQKLKTFFQEMM